MPSRTRRSLGVAVATAAGLTPLFGGVASAQSPRSTAPEYSTLNPGALGDRAVAVWRAVAKGLNTAQDQAPTPEGTR